MKYVKKFATHADYECAVESGLILPNVSLITENMATCFHSAEFSTFNPRYLYSDLSVSTTYDDIKTVIGIEVVPASHTSNHQSRFMSVVNMSLKTPEIGTTATGNSIYDSEDDSTNPGAGIKWGCSYLVPDIFSSTNSAKGLKYDTINNTLLNELSTSSATYMATDDNTQSSNVLMYPASFGPIGKYYFNNNTSEDKLPYPFTKYGKKNPLYSQRDTVTSDMNGSSNTNALINSIGVSGWETGKLNNTTGNISDPSTVNHPAAITCFRFNAGISELTHKWYLPALGELIYVFANLNAINNKLNILGNKAICIGYGNKPNATFSVNLLGSKLLSSTESANNTVWGINTSTGTFGTSLKDDSTSNSRVRAFISVPL